MRITTNVGSREGEPPMAKPASHDPSDNIAVVSLPVPVPVPVNIPGSDSDADPYVISPPNPLAVEPIGFDPDKSGCVAVTGVVTGVGVSLVDF